MSGSRREPEWPETSATPVMSDLRGRPNGDLPAAFDLEETTGPVTQSPPTGPYTGPPTGVPPPAAPRRSLPRRIVKWLALLVAGWAVAVLSLIVLYRFVDPPVSTLMLAQWLSGQEIQRTRVPFSRISPELMRAVVTAEDARFCRHHGVDWLAVSAAIEDSRDGIIRGASTITMQTAKNLFLWSSRSYVRKVLEIPLAMAIDFVWPKRRVLEVYLNIAEWGPGIFGAEAAARYHFSKSASRLNAGEAALLAASLPNPIERDAGEPGRTTALVARRIQARMAGGGSALLACLGPLPRLR